MIIIVVGTVNIFRISFIADMKGKHLALLSWLFSGGLAFGLQWNCHYKHVEACNAVHELHNRQKITTRRATGVVHCVRTGQILLRLLQTTFPQLGLLTIPVLHAPNCKRTVLQLSRVFKPF